LIHITSEHKQKKELSIHINLDHFNFQLKVKKI